MYTQVVELTLPPAPLGELLPTILAALAQKGTPLRWAITKLDHEAVHVEAAVLVTESALG
jgi:hypothetical protein